MIHVAHVITSLTTGGAESMLAKLLLEMDRGAFASEVVCLTQSGPLGDQLKEAGFPVHVLGMTRHWPWPSNWSALKLRFADFVPDVIQGWMYHGNIAASALGKPGATLWNIRSNVSPGLEEKEWTTRWVIRAGIGRSKQVRHILYNSRKSRIAHEAMGYSSERARVIPNGFSLGRFRPDPAVREWYRKEWGVPENTPVIGIVGRFHPVKDHANFLRAARRVLDMGHSARFVLAGLRMDADNAELQSLIRDLELQSEVLLLGERMDIHRVTAAFDIAALSSKSEAFPNVLGEAMACAVPCVATDVGDSGWLIGDTGFVVPPNDSEALALGIARLLDAGSEVRMGMGQKARRRVEENFSMDAVAKVYESLYAEVAAEKGRRESD